MTKKRLLIFIHMIENTCLQDVVDLVEICYEPNKMKSLHEEDSKLVECFNNFEKLYL